MAIMSRGKLANKRGWDTLNKQREEQAKPPKDKDKGKDKEEIKISEKEHEERINKLRELGFIK